MDRDTIQRIAEQAKRDAPIARVEVVDLDEAVEQGIPVLTSHTRPTSANGHVELLAAVEILRQSGRHNELAEKVEIVGRHLEDEAGAHDGAGTHDIVRDILQAAMPYVRREFDREAVADALRRRHLKQTGGEGLPWAQITDSERLRWLDLADAAIELL